jgi:hypothetical protein
MKKLKLATLCFIAAFVYMTTASAAFAYDTAKMQVEISGAQKNKYFLCVSGVGCMRIDTNKQVLPINAMDVRYIFVANRSTYQMYPQNIPSSCNVTVNSNQKLVVKGSITKAANDNVYIANLHCSVI